MAKRKAAPPEEDSEEEEFVDEDLMGSEDDDDEEAAAGGGRDFDEEEDDDEELEAEMAALESVRKERGMDRGDKPRINNEAGLDASIQDFGWTHKAKWIDHMVVAGEKDAPHVKDINDDLARETHFYEQALSSANVAVRMLKDLGVPVKRPPDFYAEMVKSDEHMKRVRAELIFEQTAQETREERRKARESKRYGKQVEAEKLKERTLKKKESIKNLDKWRKQRKQNNYSEDGAKAPEGFEDGFRNKDSPKGRKRSTQETRQKREFKDEKFGFGGRKRMKKQNDKESARDMTNFKPSNFDRDFKAGKGWGSLGAKGGRGGRGGGRGERGGGRGERGGGRGERGGGRGERGGGRGGGGRGRR